MKIFIDAGHNFSGEDMGAVGNGIREQDITFIIANKLKNLLLSSGHEVFMSRNRLEDNVGSSLSNSLNTRVNLANRYGVQLFVSIHCNAYDKKTKGTETFVYSFNSSAFEYAERIQSSIVDKLGTVDRGIKERKDLAVLRKTTMPAILVETAFIDNSSDAALLLNKADDFALAICEGIINNKLLVELTDINDIVWEYSHRGVVTDIEGMKKEMLNNPDGRLYWLARKALQYIRSNNI